ncbi:MAG: YraN family protein [Patescibacteria group bacterium]
MAIHNEIGASGENIAEKFLKSKGLEIICRNYRKPYGEIDIVARENGVIRFVEVKTVSYETDRKLSDGIRPEENMHPQKVKRLQRVVQSYVFSHETGEWVFDLFCVYIDQKTRSARVKWIKDIVLG